MIISSRKPPELNIIAEKDPAGYIVTIEKGSKTVLLKVLSAAELSSVLVVLNSADVEYNLEFK